MINIFFLSLPIAFLGFIFESYPRFINKEYGVDIWTHLLYLKEYRKQKGIPKRIENGFLVPGRYDYPPAFIWILSKFPFKKVERYEFLFSPFFDSIHIILVFYFSYLVSNNIYVSLLAQALYVLTPIVVLENVSATPRSLGYTLFTIVCTSMIFYIQSQNLLLLVIAAIFGSIIFLSHRFTTQGLLFFALIFSVIEKSLVFLGAFLASFVIGVLLSKGFYLIVLKGHLGNLKFWKKNIKYRFAHQVKGNLSPKKNKDFVFKAYNEFLKFPPFVLEITNPWVLPVLYISIFEFPNSLIYQGLVLWVGASYLLALITIWIPPFRFLGEGQRYLELSTFPASFLAANFLFSKINTSLGYPLIITYIMVGVAAFMTILVIQRKAVINEKMRTVTPEMKKMFLYLKSLKKKPRLLCIPHQITTNTIYHTNCPVFVNAGYANIEKISEVYPYLRRPIREIMRKHGLELILLDQNYASVLDLKLKTCKKVYEFGNYALLKIN